MDVPNDGLLERVKRRLRPRTDLQLAVEALLRVEELRARDYAVDVAVNALRAAAKRARKKNG